MSVSTLKDNIRNEYMWKVRGSVNWGQDEKKKYFRWFEHVKHKRRRRNAPVGSSIILVNSATKTRGRPRQIMFEVLKKEWFLLKLEGHSP